MSCPIKVNSYTIELTVHTSCYCVLDLLCINHLNIGLFLPLLYLESGHFSKKGYFYFELSVLLLTCNDTPKKTM